MAVSVIKNGIDTIAKSRVDITKIVREFLDDLRFTIDARWEVFEYAYEKLKVGNQSDRTDFNLKRDDSFLYESPCYLTRGESKSVFDVLENLKDIDTDFNLTDSEEGIFKNYCMTNFCTTIKFDW